MFRGDLALMYLIEIDSHNGELITARLAPMRMRQFRLEHASVCRRPVALQAPERTRRAIQHTRKIGERQQLYARVATRMSELEAVAGIGDAGPD